MTEKVAFVLNENGNLVPIMIEIKEREGTQYLAEKEMWFLADVEIPCPGANGFAQGMSVGYVVQEMHQAKAQQEQKAAILNNGAPVDLDNE